MANFDKARGQNVQEKAADELLGGDADQSVLSGFVIISCAKCKCIFCKADQALVGDGYAVSVATDIVVGVLGTTERSFGVDHPLLAPELSSKTFEVW